MAKKIYKLHRAARNKHGKRRALSRSVPNYKNRLPWVITYVFTETYSRPVADFFDEWIKLLKSDEEVVLGNVPDVLPVTSSRETPPVHITMSCTFGAPKEHA